MVKFVIVNGRKPIRAPFSCACCSERLEGGYIHEKITDLKYCDLVCFGFSEKMESAAIEQHGRLAS